MIHRIFPASVGTLFLLAGLLLLALAPVRGAGQTPSSDPEPAAGRKAEVLDRLARASRGITSIESDFVQESHTGMLAEPLRSEGTFRFEAPDRLHWEVLEPERFGFSVDGEEVTTWRGSGPKAGGAPPGAAAGIRHFVDQILAWVRADFDWIEDRFDLVVADDSPVTLMLRPLDPAAAGKLEGMRVVFAGDLDHVETIELHEGGGDRLVITFLNTRVERSDPRDPAS